MENGANVNDGSLYMAIELRNMDTYSNRPNPPETDRKLTATDIVKMLVARGADPNQVFDKNPPQIQTQGTVTVPEGATPFYRAVKASDLAVMRMLLDKGAKPGLAIKNGGTPLMLAAGGGPARAQEEEVVDKAGRADPVEVITMILDAGADVNAVNEQQTTARASRCVEGERQSRSIPRQPRRQTRHQKPTRQNAGGDSAEENRRPHCQTNEWRVGAGYDDRHDGSRSCATAGCVSGLRFPGSPGAVAFSKAIARPVIRSIESRQSTSIKSLGQD